MADNRESKLNKTFGIHIDAEQAVKELKNLQREAKNTVRALKEVESASDTIEGEYRYLRFHRVWGRPVREVAEGLYQDICKAADNDPTLYRLLQDKFLCASR